MKSYDSIDELHALWDSVLYVYSDDLALPLSDSDWDFLGDQAAYIAGLYPESSFSDLTKPYTEWNQESLAIAETFVYSDITENTLPSDTYIAEGTAIAES